MPAPCSRLNDWHFSNRCCEYALLSKGTVQEENNPLKSSSSDCNRIGPSELLVLLLRKKMFMCVFVATSADSGT